MMTGDGYCIGSKYGICFYGKWVWKLKDNIDKSFMNMFDPHLIFKNFSESVENVVPSLTEHMSPEYVDFY